MALERQPGQLQPGHPPLGALRQRRHGRLRQLGADGAAQQRGGLLGAEAHVALAQLGQLPTGAQAGQRQRRVGAAGHHQPQAGRQVRQEELQRLMDLGRPDQVVVVQHQHGLLGHPGQLVDEGGDHRLERGGLQTL